VHSRNIILENPVDPNPGFGVVTNQYEAGGNIKPEFQGKLDEFHSKYGGGPGLSGVPASKAVPPSDPAVLPDDQRVATSKVSNQSENWYIFAAFGVLSTVAFAYYCNKPKSSHLELLLKKKNADFLILIPSATYFHMPLYV